ncbi:LysM peptidoglycan-binding domain-containing protein [Clostridium cellulovorans]|uniref:Peptidoglycan-binding lysin domain n=1 Tax=Clostridium cellulovorans (strain ATCC 35296 / DSM 3052 / OCM 3 / 743B) TaxID=573061 RepID=D9STH4_CLOC7|nr:LysM peptidoglycan-binding domain-containing protein [Clostridium cellulovorans]ADL52708.1 Peptidoglycan-binding lysin domain [Clostridium cellulovorans 743B]
MKKKIIAIILGLAMGTSLFVPSLVEAQTLANTYTVVAGDTLGGIAKTYNVTIDSLKRWNGLTSDIIKIGQTLKLNIVHTVVAGDTLWGISRLYGTTVDAIMKQNNLTTSTLKIGQELLIEGVISTASVQTTTPTAPTTTTSQNVTHTVVSGDTLWGLSVKYKTTVDSIMKLNNLTSTTLKIGQVLVISGTVQAPAPTSVAPVVQTVNYKVVSGDNLWNIATRYGTTMDTIMKSNMLVSNILMPNQILTIPVNSTQIVKPVGITMMKAKVNSTYGDIYTWENAMRLWTVGTQGTLKDLGTSKTFNVKYMGGSNHSDVEPLTLTDTNVMKSIYGSWSWSNDHKRPMVLYFAKGGVNYQMAVSLTAMPHGVETIPNNGFDGHTDMYFYNSLGHSDPVIDQVHQANVLKANGQ